MYYLFMYVFCELMSVFFMPFMYFQRDVCTLQKRCMYFSQRYTCCRLLFVFYKSIYVFCIMYVFSNRHTYYRFMYVFWKRCASCCWRVCKRWRRGGGGGGAQQCCFFSTGFLVLRKSKPHNRRLRLLLHNRVTHHVFKCSLVRFESSLYLLSSRKQQRKAPGTVSFCRKNMPGTDSPQTGHSDCAHHRDNAHG